MAYPDWKKAFEAGPAGGEPEQAAQVWNLENEKRIGKPLGQFKRRIGKWYGGPGSPTDPATALDNAIEETWPRDSKWLGVLPVKDTGALPSAVYTHQNSSSIRKRQPGVFLSGGRPPRRAAMVEPRGRFIWVTFDVGGDRFPREDPTAVKREMGLAHYPENEFVYRFELTIQADQECFIPTCLDAGLYPPWKPRAKGHAEPWGLTRDLVDGKWRWPEVLVEVEDHFGGKPPMGEVVSPVGQAEAIKAVVPDYMVGR